MLAQNAHKDQSELAGKGLRGCVLNWSCSSTTSGGALTSLLGAKSPAALPAWGAEGRWWAMATVTSPQ